MPSIADQIVADEIKKSGSIPAAIQSVEAIIRKMDRTNAHLFHWQRALSILKDKQRQGVKILRDHYGVKGLSRSAGRANLKAAFIHLAKTKYPNESTKLLEYVQEAEHQDGDGYWDQFKNPQEVMADFKLFVENYG